MERTADNRWLTVQQNPGGKGSTLPEYLEAHQVQAAVERAVTLGAFPDSRHVGAHTFRHSYARRLLLRGIPINYLSRLLGHWSIQTTLVYPELVPDPVGRLAGVPWWP